MLSIDVAERDATLSCCLSLSFLSVLLLCFPQFGEHFVIDTRPLDYYFDITTEFFFNSTKITGKFFLFKFNVMFFFTVRLIHSKASCL